MGIDETSTSIEVVKGTSTFSECVDRFAILLSARLDFKRSGSRNAMLSQTKSRASSQTTRSQATQSQDAKLNKVTRKQSNHGRLGDEEFGEILGEIRKKMNADARYEEWRKEQARAAQTRKLGSDDKTVKSSAPKKKYSTLLPTQALTFEPSRLAIVTAAQMPESHNMSAAVPVTVDAKK